MDCTNRNLAKFGYRLEMKVENFKELLYILVLEPVV
jgi:hypothetical protein